MRRVLLCLSGLAISVSTYAQAPATQGTGVPSAPAPVVRPVQKFPKQASTSKKGARFKPEITVSTPIVTLEGVCAQTTKSTTKSKAPCKTVITRGQLDALLDAIEPNAPPKTRQQFAISYARLLAATQMAEQQHLDEDQDVLRAIQTKQKLTRMQVLTDSLLQKLEMDAQHVPQKEMEAYYNKYSSIFEQAEVRRLAVDLNSPTVSGKPLDVAAVKEKLEDLRTRAVAGDSFDQLEAQAYLDLGIKDPVPPTKLTLMHRNGLSTEETAIFDMDLGGITPVFQKQNLVMALKVVSRKMQTLQDAREEIQAVLLQQRIQEELSEASKGITAQFNLKYLESKTQPELFPPSVINSGMRRGMLSSLHVQP